MQFDAMVKAGPINVSVRNGLYRCVWTPLLPEGGFKLHGIGEADNVYAAMARAQSDAQLKGWTP